MDLLNIGKGEILLTFYDIVTGMVIKDLLQVEIRREFNLINTKVVKDGKFILRDVPRTKMGLLGYVDSDYYRYTFNITSSRYKGNDISFEFDRHTKKIDLDIALEPKQVGDDTKIY
jgi:hypothetical protein